MWRIKRFLANYSDDIILISAVIVAFYAGVWAQGLSTDYWKEMLQSPAPDTCRVCEGGAAHAPMLVNLSTGQTCELQIYDRDLRNPREINREKNGDACTFAFGPGAPITRDQASQKAMATLPDDLSSMGPEYFCRDCRALLSSVAIEGFVLLDLYDPDDKKAYEIRDGVSYEIRDYTVEVFGDKEAKSLVIEVTGHVFD